MRIIDIIKENDAEHAQALRDTGFWGKQGAGCLFLALDTGRICIAHRSRHVEQPNTWGTWGGAIDGNENPADAALREVREEAGYDGKVHRIEPLYIFKVTKKFRDNLTGELIEKEVFTYYNFLAIVEEEFKPILNWESQGYIWTEFGNWPSPLHPGLISLLQDSASIKTIKKYVSIAKQRQSSANSSAER